MKLVSSAAMLLLLVAATAQVGAVTMTFDDIPERGNPGYYQDAYGISISGFAWADQTASSWWIPHSDTHVALYSALPGHGGATMVFKTVQPLQNLLAFSVGGFFSTQPGVVLQMIGRNLGGNPVTAPVLIGSDQGWTNVFAQLDFPAGMSAVSFVPLAGDPLQAFCADDITVTFVPEPSSLLALGSGVVVAGLPWLRRRRA